MKRSRLFLTIGFVILAGCNARPGGAPYQPLSSATQPPAVTLVKTTEAQSLRTDQQPDVNISPPVGNPAQNPQKGAPATLDLLQQATQTGITVPPDANDTESHLWLSDQQLLFLRPAPGRQQFRAVLVDAETGAKTLPDTFNSLISPHMPVFETMTVTYGGSSKVRHCYEPPLHALSPDGEWLLWRAWPPLHSRNPQFSWRAARLDGSQSLEWKRDVGADEALWLRDGSGWLEFSRGTDEYSPPYRRVRLHSLSGADKPRAIRWQGVGDCIFVGVTPQQKVLVHYLDHSSRLQRQVRMAEIGFQQKVERPRRFTIQFPRPIYAVEYALSPSGDQIAWMLTDDGDRSRSNCEVWLSDIHGKGMHLLGRSDEVTAYESHLQWLPDGKRLSFLHQSALWTMPVHGTSR